MSSTQQHSDHGQHEEHAQHGQHASRDAWEIQAANLTPEERKFLEEHLGELSKTTLRAKWINNVGEREDHPGQTLATQNHDVIKHWAEERGGTPATIQSNDPNNPRVLRINFPGYGGQSLQPVTWQAWFKTFDDRHLVFLFQQKMRDGHQSNFFHMDSPEREHD
ncbi:MAG TPA: hypothetical protein VF116_02350 [Ktedonobacterales bacterium]